jgi:hypothetical protein
LLIFYEIKKYMAAYPRVIIAVVSAVCTCALILAVVNTLLDRQSLFEPFTIGVVDAGDSPEIRMVFDFLSENAVKLQYMDKAEAEAKLYNSEIPAYVELPARFAEDIMHGTNTPFHLYGNNEKPLQWALSKLLASGCVAFLSASQAGIYATIDVARAQGLEWNFINRYILFPINVAFINHMLRYGDFFYVETLPLTGNISPEIHYVFSFIAFLLMLLTLSFTDTLGGYTKAVYDRYRLAGWPVAKVQLIRFAGLFGMNTLLMLPLYGLAVYITGIPSWLGGVALAFCVSGFGLFTAAWFKKEAVGLFIFITSSVMLFFAGGMIPLVFLPQGLHNLRYAAIPYWTVVAGSGGFLGVWVLLGIGCLLLGITALTEHIRA